MNNVAMLAVDQEFTSIVQDLLDNTSSVIYVKDVEFRYLLVNRQFETLFHLSRTEILGKTDFEIFSAMAAEGFRENDRQVFESGQPLQCEETVPQDDGHHCYLSLKFPMRDTTGSIYAIAGISTDITDRIRAQREIAFLQYHQHLILDSVGDGICGLDAAGRVVFLNPAAERMLQWSSTDLRGRCHSQIVKNRKTNGRPGPLNDQNAVAAVLNGQDATRVDRAQFQRQNGTVFPVEYTVAPIHDFNVMVGVVIAFRDTTDRLRQLEIEQEIQTARRIQSSLNPKRLPAIPGFDFASMSLPCSKACGDYYDFIPWGENRLGLAVGDVSGHGLGASLEMVETRAILRTTMLSETDPVRCLSRLNQILTEDLPDDMFVTLFLALLDTQSKTLTYASAGQEATILLADGEVRQLNSTGMVLGIDENAVFSAGTTLTLRSGDLLLIATDGLVESVSPTYELFGRHRIADFLRAHQDQSADEILRALQTATTAYREREPQRDDVTAIVVKVL